MKHRWVHTVSVATRTHQIGGSEPNSASAFASVTCLIESSQGVDFRNGSEAWSQTTHLMTWGTEAIKAGYVVTWNSLKYEVLRVVSDVNRPFSTLPSYQVAWLKEIY